MVKSIRLIFSLLLLICVGVLFFTGNSQAQERGCNITAVKSAPGAGSFEFVFEGIGPEGDPFEFTVSDGESTGGIIPEGGTVTITEAPQNGYRFGGLDCESGPGIVINNFEDGFTLSCVDGSSGGASCVIRNVPLISPIPTLSEWGMISAAGGLGLVGVFFSLKKRKAQAGI